MRQFSPDEQYDMLLKTHAHVFHSVIRNSCTNSTSIRSSVSVPIRFHTQLLRSMSSSITHHSSAIHPSQPDSIKQSQQIAADNRFPPVFSNSHHNYSPTLQNALTHLDSLIDWERQSRVVGQQRQMRVDSKPCQTLLHHLNNPHHSLQSIHITGSKGKGSVSTLMESALRKCGKRTGWIRSPHVVRITERIGINGHEINDDLLGNAIMKSMEAKYECEKLHSVIGKCMTWFDVLTAAGFLAMRDMNVEWAVVEVGMGGERDSTNVLYSPVSIITNIYLEHADIIGPTRADIACEKAGIIHANAVCITSVDKNDREVATPIENRVKQTKNARLVYVESGKNISIRDENVCTARTAWKEMLAAGLLTESEYHNGLLDDAHCEKALKQLIGRAETLLVRNREFVQVPFLVDGAHVAESVYRVIHEVCQSNEAVDLKLIVIVAVGREKDSKGISKSILSVDSVCDVICTQIGTEKPYLSSREMYDTLNQVQSEMNLNRNVNVYEEMNVQNAVEVALKLTESTSASSHRHFIRENLSNKTKTMIIGIGSLHLIGKLRPMLASKTKTIE
uniref:Mur ligase central domain-containing protein n=1 Tax=Timspurckia oligopyrenoides TaxID=708627 RepID=A0A6T6NDI2_9RHOD|mmetsp:Transcript_8357/g.15118  ORF Transcript_8357/g.15118 Transcript_8357/m.15118 type:complete len:563 (+) Transcript_8357:15-1703(+)